MFTTIKEKLKGMFLVEETTPTTLEKFIISHDPKNANDIDILTRQFYNRESGNGLYNYFPNGGTHR